MFELRPYQKDVLNDPEILEILWYIKDDTRARPSIMAPLVVSATGTGKCLGRGTPVLMFDGTIRPVETIRQGEQIMGPDSKPRNVLSTCRGVDQLYLVTPVKGDAYVVNEAHILTLKMTPRSKIAGKSQNGDIVDIPVLDYLKKCSTFKHRAKGFRVAVEWSNKPEGILDPYFLGVWLGDGTSRGVDITTMDAEMVNYLKGYAESLGMTLREQKAGGRSKTYSLTTGIRPGRGLKTNVLRNELRDTLGLFGNKHVPLKYKSADRNTRLQVLAGLLDTDGSLTCGGFDYISKLPILADDVAFLARSLGLAAYVKPCQKSAHKNHSATYYRVSISGDCVIIPTRLPRKKAGPRSQIKDVLSTGIKVEKVGRGDYFGFQIDGDGRFLLGDFTVTHNTAMFCALAAKAKDWNRRTIILTHRREILEQTLKSMFRMNVTAGQIIAGKPMTGDLIQVASVPTLVNRLGQAWKPDLIITDEAHHSVAGNSWGRVHDFWGSVPRIGFTATPARLDGVGLRASFDHLIMGLSAREATDDGYLSFPMLYTIPEELHETFHITKGDYDTGEQAKVMSQKRIVGDVISHYTRRLAGAPTLVACNSLEHAELMADQFRQAGYRARMVWGDMPTKDREDAIQGLASGDVQLLCFKDLIGEGVDIPVATGLILLRKTLSLSLYLQWCGRVGRPVYAPGRDLSTREGRLEAIAMGGKPRSIILDHTGNFSLHGHPLADRAWSLDSVKRPKGELAPTTTTCPKCYGVWPGRPRACPSCGWSFAVAEAVKKEEELRIVEGELVEAGLDRGSAEEMADFVTRMMSRTGAERQKMLLGKAFSIISSDEDEETRKRKVELLAAAAGVKSGWTNWAWDFVQKRRRA